MLAKIRHFTSEKVNKNLYNAFIQPHIDYGAIIWGQAAQTNLAPLASKQNKAIRIISFMKHDDQALPLFYSKLSTLEGKY